MFTAFVRRPLPASALVALLRSELECKRTPRATVRQRHVPAPRTCPERLKREITLSQRKRAFERLAVAKEQLEVIWVLRARELGHDLIREIEFDRASESDHECGDGLRSSLQGGVEVLCQRSA